MLQLHTLTLLLYLQRLGYIIKSVQTFPVLCEAVCGKETEKCERNILKFIKVIKNDCLFNYKHVGVRKWSDKNINTNLKGVSTTPDSSVQIYNFKQIKFHMTEKTTSTHFTQENDIIIKTLL